MARADDQQVHRPRIIAETMDMECGAGCNTDGPLAGAPMAWFVFQSMAAAEQQWLRSSKVQITFRAAWSRFSVRHVRSLAASFAFHCHLSSGHAALLGILRHELPLRECLFCGIALLLNCLASFGSFCGTRPFFWRSCFATPAAQSHINTAVFDDKIRRD